MSKPLECVGCAFNGAVVTEGVEMESSRTMYHFDGAPGSPDDPNRPIALCREHATEHHANWDEMWAEHRSGLL
jgi:hypothetical protein